VLDVEAPQYHRSLRRHFESTEPELWAWFTSASRPSQVEIDEAELRLLKSTYRLDGDVHGVLVGVAAVGAARLGIEREVCLHQELHADERNARVLTLGNRIHIVFSGDLLDLLTLAEQEAVLFHELAHAHLLERESKAYLVLDRLVDRLDHEAALCDAVGETARRLRLHTEVWADSIALAACADERAVVSMIVKLSTGLRNVDPDAYLRQAREIVETDASSSRGSTHPELHVRIACLAARSTHVANNVVDDLIDGPDDLDHLDVLGQLRLQKLTARVLGTGLRIAMADSTRPSSPPAYARQFPELGLANRAASPDPLTIDELAGCTGSVRHLAAALLVDLTLVGDDGDNANGVSSGLDRVGAFTVEAYRIGVGAEFEKLLARAVDRTVADLRRSRS
jgi:hypothetical protein